MWLFQIVDDIGASRIQQDSQGTVQFVAKRSLICKERESVGKVIDRTYITVGHYVNCPSLASKSFERHYSSAVV